MLRPWERHARMFGQEAGAPRTTLRWTTTDARAAFRSLAEVLQELWDERSWAYFPMCPGTRRKPPQDSWSLAPKCLGSSSWFW